MKKIFVMMFALSLGAGAANAQEVTNTETVETTEQMHRRYRSARRFIPTRSGTAASITASRASSLSTA